MSGKIRELAEAASQDKVSETSAESIPAVSGESAPSGEAAVAQGEGEPNPKEGTPPAPEEEGEPAEKAAYTPKTTFRVLAPGSKDEKVEHEVPKWLQPLMKDEASEKEVMSILHKAYGLETVQASREEIRRERDEVKQNFGQLTEQINELREVYQKGDIDLWLEKLAIPPERMLQWALDRVNYSQLPPEQQQLIDGRQQAQRQAWTAEKQSRAQSSQFSEQARTTKLHLLESGLTRPDVQTLAEAYDARQNKPGAFRDEVIALGNLAWMQSGGQTDLSPDQAIDLAVKKWGPFLSPKAPAAAPNGAQAVTPGGAPAKAAGVIPNVQGKSSSPMKAKPRSVEDLKKLRDQFAAQG